mgnify:CR=1 FL=1
MTIKLEKWRKIVLRYPNNGRWKIYNYSKEIVILSDLERDELTN